MVGSSGPKCVDGRVQLQNLHSSPALLDDISSARAAAAILGPLEASTRRNRDV